MHPKETLEDLEVPEKTDKPIEKKESKDSIEPKDENPVIIKSKKKKYLIIAGIILGILIILTTIFLLVAHYEFGLFGSEIYKVAEVKRELDSVEYFTETKTIKTKLAYTSGELEELENKVQTDFAVMLTNKNDSLNTANIVLLKSKTRMKDKEASLNSFDIFDETVVKEFEENPDGSKYPIAEFHFFDNGTIYDINLPEEMTKEEAQNMVDLINNVIPKLTRNKTEDENNGIKIRKTKSRKKQSLTEYENPKEFIDKYTNTTFKGSKITKEVEREIENETISEINTNTNLYLETQEEKDNKNYFDFGFKNFYYNSSSKIILRQIQKEQKDIINLVKRLTSKLTLMESEQLIQAKISKEIEEQQKNLNQSQIQNETVLDTTTINENITEEKNLRIRNLDSGDSGDNRESFFGFHWDVIKTNILGQDTSVGYYVELSGGKITNGLFLKFGWSTYKVGNLYGLTKNKKKGSERQDDIPLAKIPLGCLPVKLSIKVGSSLDFGVNLGLDNIKVELSGSLFMKAAVEFGIDNFASIEAGIRGDFIKVSFSTSFKRKWDWTYYKDKISLKATTGNVKAYATAKVWIWTVFSGEFEVFKVFQIAEINW